MRDIHATDVDPVESAKTKKRLAEQGFGEDMLTIHLQKISARSMRLQKKWVDLILFWQILAFRPCRSTIRSADFPLKWTIQNDLRLNQGAGISAAERLDTISRDELAGMLYENSDEPYCEELAKAITDEIRKGHRVDTTTKLRRIIEDTLDFLPEKDKKKTIKRPVSGRFRHFALMSTESLRCFMNLWKNCRVL